MALFFQFRKRGTYPRFFFFSFKFSQQFNGNYYFALTSCSQDLGSKVVNTVIPPSKPSPPEVVDPYKRESDLLEKELNGIKFLSDLGEEEDKKTFLKSSQALRERLSEDSQLKERLRSKMPAEIWLTPKDKNYSFVDFDPDVIQPLIRIAKFATAEELIEFIDTFPDRSTPEISKRIESLEILKNAGLGKGRYKINIYVSGNSIVKAINNLNKVERVLIDFSDNELEKIGRITLGFKNEVGTDGDKFSFQLNESSPATDWNDFIKANL